MIEEVRFVVGGLPCPDAEFLEFLRANGGREWAAGPLPPGVRRGTPKECFKNATLAAVEHGYRYVEGVAFIPEFAGIGMAFLHAWCADADGNVVDPTWDNPERCRYYGVAYPKRKYMRHVTETRMYGVFGGLDVYARGILKKGKF